MLRVAPVAVALDAQQFFGDAVLLVIALVPQRIPGGNQTLVDGRVGGIGHSFGDGFLSVRSNRVLKQLVNSSMPVEVHATRMELVRAQPPAKFSFVLAKKAVLGRFGLFWGSSPRP